ncbi:MAG: cytochrome c oxidase subunit II [Candidatus Eremiobacteraeota bacterium]|nr:cytochrome c oxidase subunit II [Candidatus Eremiobacteraeota bacterium]
MQENRDPAVRLDRGFWIASLVLGVVALAGALFWVKAPIDQWLPESADKAAQIDALFRFLAASGTALFVYVIGIMLYFAFAFRRRASDAPDAIGVQIHDSHKLELWWTIIPTIFVVIMAIFSIRIWAGIQLGDNNGLVVEALGHQWNYTFRYPQIHGEIPDEMHLPVGTPVTLHVTSYDVIHSFWVPSMRLKADMVPGIINTLRFTPTHPGRYKLLCTEFCGTFHGVMAEGINNATQKAQVVVIDSPAAYKAWYDSWQRKNAKVSDAIPTQSTAAIALAGGSATGGKVIFSQKCTACHSVGKYSDVKVGPGLGGVLHDPAHPKLVDGDPATPASVAKILQQGYKGDMGQMPSQVQNAITNKDIADLVSYLDSLK